MKSQDLQKFNLPDAPGVYFWKKGSEILYIGKATSLRDRVRSYFGRDVINTRGPAIVDMVTTAEIITYEQTDTVIEALMLEANLIKKYQPKYNIKEKDNKSFAYIVITAEPFPRIGVVRGRTLQIQKQIASLSVKIKKTFGPFPSYSSLLAGLKIVRKIFPYRDLKSYDPTHDRFYQQLALAPNATNDDAQKKYLQTVKNIIQFLQGDKQGVINSLQKQMNDYAKKQQFEQAYHVKKQLYALEHINDVSLIKRDFYDDAVENSFRIESYDIAHLSGDSMVGVMTVVENGYADKSSYRKFKIKKLPKGSVHDLASLQEILERRFSHDDWKFPALVVVDGGRTHYQYAQQILQKLKITIPVVAVVKDEQHRPKAIIGDDQIIKNHKKEILLANSESHRFAIGYHTLLRNKKFL
jgi:excinuclease ABC subunit C